MQLDVGNENYLSRQVYLTQILKWVFLRVTFGLVRRDRQTKGSAYEPSMQYAQMGSKKGQNISKQDPNKIIIIPFDGAKYSMIKGWKGRGGVAVRCCHWLEVLMLAWMKHLEPEGKPRSSSLLKTCHFFILTLIFKSQKAPSDYPLCGS